MQDLNPEFEPPKTVCRTQDTRVSKNLDKTKFGVLRAAGHPFAGQGRRTGFQDAGRLIIRDCALQISFFLFASGPLVSERPDATIGIGFDRSSSDG